MLAAREIVVEAELEIAATGVGRAARSAVTVVLLFAARICCKISGDSITEATSEACLPDASEVSGFFLSLVLGGIVINSNSKKKCK